MNAHFAASLDSLQPLLAFVASSDQREEFARIVFDELERSSEELAERQFLEVAGQSVEAREKTHNHAVVALLKAACELAGQMKITDQAFIEIQVDRACGAFHRRFMQLDAAASVNTEAAQ